MKKINVFLFIVMGLSAATACKKKDKNEGVETKGTMILAATPGGTYAEGADYLLATETFESGKISTTGNGIEQNGYRYYAFHKNKVFSLLYGQGNPGAVTVYKLNENKELKLFSNLQTESVHVFGKVKDDLLLIKVPRSGEASASIANFYRINADNPSIVGTATINTATLAGNGERAYFTGAFQVGDKVYAPYMCIKGKTDSTFHTKYTDSTWVAVFSYPGLVYEKTIKDNRTGFIGYYFAQNGLRQIENGDVYAFSNAQVTGAGVTPSTKPSAAIRIKSGQSEFDQSYFFNIQSASGGHHLYREDYLGNGKFLLVMYSNPNTTAGTKTYAIVDVINQTFNWVTGLPAPANIKAIARLPYVAPNGKTASVGITDGSGLFVYQIDVNTFTAKKGLEVEAGSLTALGELLPE
ncbi:DUF4374 domain-containing protein [Cytophaga hutchinsonii]|uniref:DUF4374 domain-containing protein n=1 Tax=Cytophaga hutchinsonii (strain ATCC 33406 / DSM 1761 / CIP 103989 / NBRC 15051 / NCIMB 9469 / D465) TaxID=269798 RepID=A0A6N4SX95_CYTH3|nr:DUF4374 domain-containing protein [Cytophaga hutchinsonii]ABG60989.1 conserved hypothetical protein [Cytophaga hutchinsonii ATCC 33406]SFX43865.1 protein of unknown function [Cytophaga hutchinsonii ATCC 33406]